MVTVRELVPEELTRVHSIDVSETGTVVYRTQARRLAAEPEAWHRSPRGPAQWAAFAEEWREVLAQGGAALGAFEDDRLVGIAVVRFRLTETMAQLVGLFVSREMRRHGVATMLVREAVRLAGDHGAQALYVSATPSESAVGFYLSQGFVLATEPHPALYAREPEDIHLTRAV